MAISFWEKIVDDIFKTETIIKRGTKKGQKRRVTGDPALRKITDDLLRRVCKLNIGWTKAAIRKSLAIANISLGEDAIKEAADAFHDEILRHKGKPKVIKATRTILITATGTYGDTVLNKARKAAREALAKNAKNLPDGKGTTELHFSHGEFGQMMKEDRQAPITTKGTIKGTNLINLLNSFDFMESFVSTESGNKAYSDVVREHILFDLLDFYKEELYWDIKLEAGEKVADVMAIYGAAKIQSDKMKEFDYPFTRDKKTQKRLNDLFNERIKKALSKLQKEGKFEAKRLKGSPQFTDRYKAAGIKQITKQFKKVKGLKISDTAIKKGLKDKKKTPVKTLTFGAGKTVRKGRKATSRATKQELNPGNVVSLKELINAVLPNELLEQMQSPRLVNRTGRFRQSAEVLNVTMGKKGGLNIDYTYQKDPYQVFEPGGRLYTRSRDPQGLIGGSIREIAQELVGKRYIRTRRV